MFEYSSITEIISFLNSVIRNGKLVRYHELCENAVSELEDRCYKMAILYRHQVDQATEFAKSLYKDN